MSNVVRNAAQPLIDRLKRMHQEEMAELVRVVAKAIDTAPSDDRGMMIIYGKINEAVESVQDRLDHEAEMDMPH